MPQRGRPKKNKLITSLKVRTWFHAVAIASGKTAYELEREFSPAYLANDDEFAKHRPRLWEKYRLGTIEPSSKPIKGSVKSIAERVEETYPGTIFWLQTPLWKLADYDYAVSLEEIRAIYHTLDPMISKYLIFKNSPDSKQVFWRNSRKSKATDIAEIYDIGGINSIIALSAIIRESMICQDIDTFHEANLAVITLLEKETHTPFDIVRIKVRAIIIRSFTSTWIPAGPSEYLKPFFDPKHRDVYIRHRENGDGLLIA